MNIYLISQDVNNTYNTYDACIVVANTEDEARLMHPDKKWIPYEGYCSSWAYKPEQVNVKLIGTANSDFTGPQFILASFNAG